MYAPWVRPFLEQLTDTGNVSGSARAAGISSTTAYALRNKDADFAASWDQALEDSADTLEAEARRRAVEGVDEPLVHQGQFTPEWQRNPDGTLLMESYEVPPTKDAPAHMAQRPVQKVDAHGRPMWQTRKAYSDSLLALLLKGRRKRVFADRTELTGADGGEMKVVDSTARAARIAYLMAQAAKRKTDADNFGDIA